MASMSPLHQKLAEVQCTWGGVLVVEAKKAALRPTWHLLLSLMLHQLPSSKSTSWLTSANISCMRKSASVSLAS